MVVATLKPVGVTELEVTCVSGVTPPALGKLNASGIASGTNTPMLCVLGVPVVAGASAVSVIVQVAPPTAVPADAVTVAGTGVTEPSANVTVEAESVQPPVTPRLPVTAPEAPPERFTEKTVEPVVTGKLVSVFVRLRESEPGDGGAATVAHPESCRIPIATGPGSWIDSPFDREKVIRALGVLLKLSARCE